MRDLLPFLRESEKLKAVERRSRPVGLERRENSAEHSWSLALLAMCLVPGTDPSLDAPRVLRMVLLHDLVEIDAGDTFCYGDQSGKLERETAAATRIFGLLPGANAAECLALWQEFEEAATPEARMANALDRFLPVLQNHANEGGSWVELGVARDQVEARIAIMEHTVPELWQAAREMLDDAVARGWLR